MSTDIAGREVHVERVVHESGKAKVVFRGLEFHDKFTLLRAAGFYQPGAEAQQYVSRVACLGGAVIDEESLAFELHSEDTTQAVEWAGEQLSGLDARRDQTRAVLYASLTGMKSPNLR